jgi:hypothetical protein
MSEKFEEIDLDAANLKSKTVVSKLEKSVMKNPVATIGWLVDKILVEKATRPDDIITVAKTLSREARKKMLDTISNILLYNDMPEKKFSDKEKDVLRLIELSLSQLMIS